VPAPSHAWLPPRRTQEIRSYTPRFRVSELTRDRLGALLPRYAVTSLPVDPPAAFGRPGEVVLEIGSGHGAAALAYAAAHPFASVLAVEVHVPGVARMLAAADDAGVTNLRVYVGDALDLLSAGLPPSSVDRIHLFFPDPWPKRRHEKRRLVQRHTLDRMAGVLAPGGVLLIGTDHPVYADHARALLAAHPDFTAQETHRPEWKPLDGFEEKGLRAGRPPVYLEARRRHDAFMSPLGGGTGATRRQG
jgi:tRNA (guanine-N7-)-methyltransferase